MFQRREDGILVANADPDTVGFNPVNLKLF
jgi:hypothetical protein